MELRPLAVILNGAGDLELLIPASAELAPGVLALGVAVVWTAATD